MKLYDMIYWLAIIALIISIGVAIGRYATMSDEERVCQKWLEYNEIILPAGWSCRAYRYELDLNPPLYEQEVNPWTR